MLKVLIADDEKKICRLINMICDWDRLNMTVVGNAYNGFEILEKTDSLQPDILILDIKMPGCDGTEVVRRLSARDTAPQIMMISGHADFEYAHAAIRYGVSSYLLKPIKKTELEKELSKISKACCQKREREAAASRLKKYIEDESARNRSVFIREVLMKETGDILSDREDINERYGYKFEEGMFRVLILQLHYNSEKHSTEVPQNAAEKYKEAILESLSPVCSETEIYADGNKLYILCNYPEDERESFDKEVARLVQRLSERRFMLWKIDFSLGAGKPVEDIKGLRNSLEDALSAAREVLVEGCEKVLKSRVKQGRKYDSGVIREFSQQCAKAVELLEEQIAIDAVEKLKEYIGSEASLTGEDIFDIVAAAGKQMILTAAPAQEDAESMRFCAECELCTSVDAILELLKKEICLLFDRLRN